MISCGTKPSSVTLTGWLLSLSTVASASQICCPSTEKERKTGARQRKREKEWQKEKQLDQDICTKHCLNTHTISVWMLLTGKILSLTTWNLSIWHLEQITLKHNAKTPIIITVISLGKAQFYTTGYIPFPRWQWHDLLGIKDTRCQCQMSNLLSSMK